MWSQRDPIINTHLPDMEPTGCASLLPFWSAHKYNDLYVDRALVVSKIKHWIKKGWVGDELYIIDWAKIHEDLGLHVEYYGHQDPDTAVIDGYFAYGYWEYCGLHHFTAVSSGMESTYDPLGDSLFPKHGTLESLRYFRLL